MYKKDFLVVVQYPAWVSAGSAQPNAERVWYEGACKRLGHPGIYHDGVGLAHFLFELEYG